MQEQDVAPGASRAQWPLQKGFYKFYGFLIFAHGSRFGGHALFIKDKKLHYVYNFLGIKPEQHFVYKPLKPGKYTLGVEFVREKAGEHG